MTFLQNIMEIRQLLSLNNLEEAISLMERTLDGQVPQDADPGPLYANLCRLYLHKGRFEIPIRFLQKAVQVDSNIFGQLYQLGSRLLDGKHYEEASLVFSQLNQIQPQDADIWVKLGAVFSATGNIQEAEKCLAKAITIDPYNAEYKRLKGLITGEYEKVRPNATYSPWNKDKLFQAAFASIKDFTLVGKYRCFELWKLVEQSAKLKNGSIIEIGVWRGGTGALMARQAKNIGIVDKVFLCDTFSGVVKTGSKDSFYRGGEHADVRRQDVEELIFKCLGLDNVEILEGIFPEQTGSKLEGIQFRFCHIDVDVYQSAKDIVDWIWNKMVPHGIIVFDDYGFESCDGIARYVDEQMMLKDRLVIHNLNGHAIFIKLTSKSQN